MAIIKGFRGIAVDIRANGQIAREYNDPDPELTGEPPRTPSSWKYIESVSNATFSTKATVWVQ